APRQIHPFALRIAALCALAVLAALLAWKTSFGVALGCAFAGGGLALVPFSVPHPRLVHLGLSLALFGLALAARRRKTVDPPSWRIVTTWALGLGALGGCALWLAWRTARDLPARGDPFAPRLAQLRSIAPHGGLVWPLPSEAIFWDHEMAREFPLLPNLDSFYLGGGARGLWRLPGTTRKGRVTLTREVIRLRAVKDATEVQALRAAAQASVR